MYDFFFVGTVIGLLHTVLDKSKTEAGKTELFKEEFKLAQVLEDVGMYYPVGIMKGIDVMLDSCDSFILNFYLVRVIDERSKRFRELA